MAERQEPLLTASEASRITGLNPETLRRLAWQRRIRSFKVLGALRFKRQDLEALIVERPAIRREPCKAGSRIEQA
jgi:excisionase family DNA binding protein